MGVKGNARFSLFGSTVLENTVIESQSSVTVDFKWSHVESILEAPPLSSTATMVSSSSLPHRKHILLCSTFKMVTLGQIIEMV